METVLDHLLHTLFQVRLKHWQVATDTTHSFVFSFLICTADCAYMYCLFSPILTAATDDTTSGTKPTRNALGSDMVHEL